LVTPILGKTRKLSSKSKIAKSSKKGKKVKNAKIGKNCKREIKAVAPKSCKGVETYNGLLDSLPAPNATSTNDISRCLIALQLSGLVLDENVQFDAFFNEDSVMMIPDVGVFVGLNAIIEYANVAYREPGEAFVIKNPVSYPETVQVLPIKAEGNDCIILQSSKATFTTYDSTLPVDLLLGYRITYTILEDGPTPSKILVNRVDIRNPKGLVGYYYDQTKGDVFARLICETMQNNCASTFANNCYNGGDSIDKCITDMLTLPAHEEGRIDGKSFGCRILHSLLVPVDNNHCAHVSFDPEYDLNCALKCQKSKEITNEDVFHPTEIAFMAQHALSLGLGERQWQIREEEN